MLVNRENVSEIFRNINTSFNAALQATQTQWPNIATRIPTMAIVEKMDWLGEFPNWREWVGDKVMQNLSAYPYTVTLTEYEASIAVKRRDIEADRYGIYGQQARSQGELAAYFPEERVADAVNNSFTDLCHDGQAFFSNSHPLKAKDGSATTFDNLETAALTVSTQAAAIASYGAAKTKLRSMKNSQGRPIRVRNFMLVVPPALEDIGQSLLTNDRLEDGKPNIYRGTAQLMVWEELTSSTAWFLCGQAGGLKPFMYLERKAATPANIDSPDSDHVKMTGEFVLSIEADGAGAYTFPQLAVGSTGAG